MAPASIFTRLKRLYYGRDELPTLPTRYAVIASFLFTLLYVGVLYLNPATRPSAQQSRDAPRVIRQRIKMVSIACLITFAATFWVLSSWTGRDFWACLQLMGIWPIKIVDIAKALGLTAVLFVGPLAERLFLEGNIGEVYEDAITALRSWMGYRNYVVGPFTEELTFRTCIISLHLVAPSVSTAKMVLLTPLYFGVAHFHHFYEFVLTHPGMVGIGIARSLLQFTYTTLFGWYAAFIYIRLGSLWAAILVHSFCNSMGLPRFYGSLEGGAWRTGVYYILLVTGAVSFWKLLWPWTASRNALAKFV